MTQKKSLGSREDRLGFSTGGAISSRTAMLKECETLFATLPADASAEKYRQAILDDNILDKATASNRDKTFKFLRRLYALDPTVTLFRELRRLYGLAKDDARLLLGLLAMAREPILRECLGSVLAVPIGESIDRHYFEDWIRGHSPGQYSESMYVSFSHNLYGSFYPLGYLGESVGKARCRIRPKVGIASATYAAFLDWLHGMNGLALLQGPYSSALDLGADEHIALLAAAGRQGLLKAAYSGGVLELAFPGFLKNDETRCIP